MSSQGSCWCLWGPDGRRTAQARRAKTWGGSAPTADAGSGAAVATVTIAVAQVLHTGSAACLCLYSESAPSQASSTALGSAGV
jgi:hypothetical protein